MRQNETSNPQNQTSPTNNPQPPSKKKGNALQPLTCHACPHHHHHRPPKKPTSAMSSASAAAAAAAHFIPRRTFPRQDFLPRSYFLGHHKAGLDKMKSRLSTIDFVIECRDYRVPISSQNPLFEDTLVGKDRLIVYTKRDLGSSRGSVGDCAVCLCFFDSLLCLPPAPRKLGLTW